MTHLKSITEMSIENNELGQIIEKEYNALFDVKPKSNPKPTGLSYPNTEELLLRFPVNQVNQGKIRYKCFEIKPVQYRDGKEIVLVGMVSEPIRLSNNYQ